MSVPIAGSLQALVIAEQSRSDAIGHTTMMQTRRQSGTNPHCTVTPYHHDHARIVYVLIRPAVQHATQFVEDGDTRPLK